MQSVQHANAHHGRGVLTTQCSESGKVGSDNTVLHFG